MSRVYPPPPPPRKTYVIKNSRLLTCAIRVTIGEGRGGGGWSRVSRKTVLLNSRLLWGEGGGGGGVKPRFY